MSSSLAPLGISLGFALAGALLYALSQNAKAAEVGRLLCAAGLLVFVLIASGLHVAVR